MCAIDYCCWVLLGLVWVTPMMPLNSHVTCSCIFHHTIFSYLLWTCVSFCFLSPSLSDRLHYGTQTAQIYSDSKPSSRFQVFFFFYSSRTLSYSIPWWEGQDRLPWEIPGPWRSSETPGHSTKFLQHYATQCHSDSGMGISLWETHALPHRVYSGVLLQLTQHRYLCVLVCFYIQRYTYRSYSGSYIRGATRPWGSAS